MPAATVTLADLRQALSDLTLAATLACPRGNTERQRLVRAAVAHANALLAARLLPDVSDPEALVQGYIAAGGEWRALANAVNRNAGTATARAFQEQLKRQSAERAPEGETT